MKITPQILNIPPFISAAWKNIHSLFMEKKNLIILLNNGTKIEIPDLDQAVLEKIFKNHAKYLESEQIPPSPPAKSPAFKSASFSLGLPLPIDGMGMQHNPEQKNAPDLPPEILKKIAAVAKTLGLPSMETLPKPEPHCNCMYCQLAKALRNNSSEEEILDEEVSDADLKFRLWDIEETGDKLYVVTNPLDKNEKYSVYLGTPLGCTCGQKNCEHIRAVLKS